MAFEPEKAASRALDKVFLNSKIKPIVLAEITHREFTGQMNKALKEWYEHHTRKTENGIHGH